ncbi:hypothetical protein PGT21_013191 [Puccinia graminis f. sp. tritici]|uniref:Uncharacterized protein n=1 Tax=Puccinia graminis f. sp. tritici TaxID=56615 RepID=A0A5B0NAW2_PUCGR|nr:hypothetical protein PGT21_013191 [Puccinia graminis f. sp. tritici]KAA1136035.1 hypothetical protein PGTUg99_023686 [Puccinia graminis f. sp. tritici]
MRFTNFFNLCMLLLIQSEAVYSRFVCEDMSKPKAKLGICVRHINIEKDSKVPNLPPLDKKDFLAIDATPKGTDRFTCDGLTLPTGAITARYCCDLQPDTKPRTLEKAELAMLCYSRDAKKKSHKS